MKKTIIISIAVTIAGLFLCAVVTVAKETKVQVLDPARDGIEVRKTYVVKGSAFIPSGTHVWVLARRVDFEGFWWPQGEGKVDPKTGEWKVSVTFGEQQDVGWDFDIATVVVAEQSHLIFKNYRTNAMRSGDWKPIELPKVEVPPVLRKVKKVGH
jgi:hypothetical protein